MNQIQIFQNQEFGAIRTLSNEQGEPLFCGKDVALALGYSNTKDALLRHVETEDKLGSRITTSGQSRTMTFINESGLYALILSSKLEGAKRFKHWVTSEVLASIRTVLKLSGLDGNENFSQPSRGANYERLELLIRAMTTMECGIPYKEVDVEAIRQGFDLAFPKRRKQANARH